jgi:uncharacterized protein
VTLIAAEDAGIRSIADLNGKRVNIGNIGSGQRQNAIDALEAEDIDYETDLKAEGVKAAKAPGLLQERRIDVFFILSGIPAGPSKRPPSGRAKFALLPLPVSMACWPSILIMPNPLFRVP